MGMGFGSQMTGSSMVIMWSNSDGSITLSQRKATGESEPPVDANPSTVATLATDLSVTSGTVQFVYTMPSTSATSQNIIFAFGGTNPRNPAVDASLEEHLDYGNAKLDLTKVISSSSDGGYGGGSGDSSTTIETEPLLPYQRLIVVHAILCVIGFLLFLPAGALLARYLRTSSPSWFMGHWIAQFAISAPLILAGFALGLASVSQAGARHLDDSHKKWGVAIFMLYLVQCGLGAVIHWVKPKRSTRRPPQNYLHAVLGLAIIGLALYQVRSGYSEEWSKTTSREVPSAINTIWYVWVIILPVLYAVGLAFLPRQFRQEAMSRHRYGTDGSDDDHMNMTNRQKYRN
ncbi:hypothetical protein C8J56DRAFT_91195 [Mycena floridula]|nr:hypothetical protein C8J56DRAFT_91195 [Mycena floridula]